MTDLLARFGVPPKPLRRPRAAADFATGVWLSRAYGNRAVSPMDVAHVLAEADVRHVLVGIHAVNAYSGRPRATADVDVVAAAPKTAARALAAAFPRLIIQQRSEGVRFADEKLPAIDLLNASRSKFFRELLKMRRRVPVPRPARRLRRPENAVYAAPSRPRSQEVQRSARRLPRERPAHCRRQSATLAASWARLWES